MLKNDPQSVQGLIGMANVLLDEGRTDDVVTLCKRTLSLDERNSQAYALLGDVYIARAAAIDRRCRTSRRPWRSSPRSRRTD